MKKKTDCGLTVEKGHGSLHNNLEKVLEEKSGCSQSTRINEDNAHKYCQNSQKIDVGIYSQKP
jgi:hypothetical protein